MRRRQWILSLPVLAILSLALARDARASDWTYEDLPCPIDGTTVEAFVFISHSSFGCMPDFRPLGDAPDMFTLGLNTCPTCGFTAHTRMFREPPAGLDKARILAAIAAVRKKSPPLFRHLDTAAAIERELENQPDMLARYALTAKWLADDTGEPDVIRQRLTQAIEAQKRYLAVPTRDAGEWASTLYLIGELYFELGDDRQALHWLNLALRQIQNKRTPKMSSCPWIISRQWSTLACWPSGIAVASRRRSSSWSSTPLALSARPRWTSCLNRTTHACWHSLRMSWSPTGTNRRSGA
jgi:hypothetical protein